jgi:hypothetical protein
MGPRPKHEHKKPEAVLGQFSTADRDVRPYRRLFLTIDERTCPFRCVYCFAQFSGYDRVPSLHEAESGLVDFDQFDIIYPACDVDLFATSAPVDYLWRIAEHRKSISVSTVSV